MVIAHTQIQADTHTTTHNFCINYQQNDVCKAAGLALVDVVGAGFVVIIR